MKNWNININLKVADSWVADGFDAKERLEQIEELLTQLLPYAHDHEFIIKASVRSTPSVKVIHELQSGEAEIKD